MFAAQMLLHVLVADMPGRLQVAMQAKLQAALPYAATWPLIGNFIQ